jgi:hypothetical protein
MGIPQHHGTPPSLIFPLKPPDHALPFLQASGIWDPTAALNSHNSGALDSTALLATASSTASVTGGGSSTSTSSASSSKSSSNAGAIAGGVVGGLVGVALIGMAVFLFMRRRRNAMATPASAQFVGGRVRGEKVDLTGHSLSYGGIDTPALPMQNEPPRLYVRVHPIFFSFFTN